MTELATEAELIRGQWPKTNGVEFPYPIHEDGAYTDSDRGGPTTLWLPLVVDDDFAIRTRGIDTCKKYVDSDARFRQVFLRTHSQVATVLSSPMRNPLLLGNTVRRVHFLGRSPTSPPPWVSGSTASYCV